jgi:hypothetical protein
MVAKAAIYGRLRARGLPWVPAFAGMTKDCDLQKQSAGNQRARRFVHLHAC